MVTVSSALMCCVRHTPLLIITSKHEAISILEEAVFLHRRRDEELILHQNHLIQLQPNVSF